MTCVSDLAAGDVLDVVVGDVAHGGWCAARAAGAPSGLVIFVRHALPGERVRARITQTTARFVRADAIEIIEAAPQRVRPPCPYAGPGGCGGCDWQHVSPPGQRDLKARVVEQQLRRIAGIERAVVVEQLPGDLGWRTRVRFAVGPDGRAGLHRHRSHDIVPVTDCLIAHRLVNEAGVTRGEWPGARSVQVVVAAETGQRVVVATGAAGGASRREAGRPFLTQRAAGRDWRVSASTFWQVHPSAADALADAVLAGLAPAAGERAFDLFCGAGLFAGVLADAVGPGGTVIAVESDVVAAADARRNLRSTPWVRVYRGDVVTLLRRVGLGGAALAVLDPPRSGLPRGLAGILSAPPSAVRRIGYVSCDPATLARDLAEFQRHGWELADLRAFDAFPMTHHVECVAIVTRPPS
jgi:tRNA/tmRNA/rRNA uracil-C5-methylase (TrmA/RlmC/RlmD family)